MLVNVGDILLDRDNRRAGREVEVISVHTDSVTIQTVKTIGGTPVEDGTVSEVSKVRLPKAYRHKIDEEGFVENKTESSVKFKVENNTPLDDNAELDGLVDKVVSKIMKIAEPGNKAILDRITALEARANSIEYGGTGYWKPNVYSQEGIDGSVIPGATINNVYSNTLTGSVVSNYPSIEEVLEKVLPETESDEFEYLWERLASEDKNPHEAVIRLVYNLLTK